MRPLYRSLAHDSDLLPENGNTGLWYDKFCNTWPGSGASATWSLKIRRVERTIINPKTDWIKTVSGKKAGAENLLEEACSRQQKLADASGMKVFKFATTWRFVTGLGRQHPVENGFAWHQTLGVPYLPGSSVKGMVRAWAEQWEKTTDGNRIFGPRKNEVSAGSVIFLDALPVRPVLLEEDVMTPHYTPYYRDGEPPGDWYDPVPIPFLTVAAGQTFQFAVISRRMHDDKVAEDTRQAAQWLQAALECMGAGAKTAVGYGRFQRQDGGPGPDSETQQWQDATVKYTPNNGRFTVTDAASGQQAVCPQDFQPDMKNRLNQLSKTRLKKAKGQGLPCSATVIIQGNQFIVQTISVTWTGEETISYGDEG